MTPLKTKIGQLGGSAFISIPLTLAKMFDWAPGAVVDVRVGRGFPVFRQEVRALYGGRSAGVIIPAEVLRASGHKIGDKVAVPYYNWKTHDGVQWPQDDE